MKHAKYKGPRAEFRFCGALVRPDPRSRRHWLVQFDCMRRPDGSKVRPDETDMLCEVWACVGWHRFKRSDFRLPPPPSQSHTRKRLREWCERGVHWFNGDTDICSSCGETRQALYDRAPVYTPNFCTVHDSQQCHVGCPYRIHGKGCNCIICLPEPHSPASLEYRD